MAIMAMARLIRVIDGIRTALKLVNFSRVIRSRNIFLKNQNATPSRSVDFV
jgi:hypothetical protein